MVKNNILNVVRFIFFKMVYNGWYMLRSGFQRAFLPKDKNGDARIRR